MFIPLNKKKKAQVTSIDNSIYMSNRLPVDTDKMFKVYVYTLKISFDRSPFSLTVKCFMCPPVCCSIYAFFVCILGLKYIPKPLIIRQSLCSLWWVICDEKISFTSPCIKTEYIHNKYSKEMRRIPKGYLKVENKLSMTWQKLNWQWHGKKKTTKNDNKTNKTIQNTAEKTWNCKQHERTKNRPGWSPVLRMGGKSCSKAGNRPFTHESINTVIKILVLKVAFDKERPGPWFKQINTSVVICET